MSGERPVVFAGPRGEPLFGILHEPERPRTPRTGVNLLNPGLKSRVAPNRLNVVLARKLAADGYWVLRFDPPGVGDSAGDLPEEMLPEIWQQVQRGAFVEATRIANRVFAETCGLDEVVGMGNCGGAITALLAAEGDARVGRLALLDLPVTIRDTDPGERKMIRGKRHGAKVLAGYWRRAKDWRAWLRLIAGRSDLQTITKALRARFVDPAREALSKRAALRNDGAPPAPDPATAPGEHLSEMFVEAFSRFHDRGGRMLFVNAGNYDNTFVFDRLFADSWLRPGTPWAGRHPRVVVPGANHVYGTPEWRASLLDAVFDWLDGRAVRGASVEPLTISVVIPTMNRRDDLERCLRSIVAQERKPDEVVVVDDGDVDVRPLGAIVEGSGIRFIYEKKTPDTRGLCTSRNVGVRLSRGDVVIFLDDDTELDAGYVRAYAEIFENDPDRRIGGLTGARMRYRGAEALPAFHKLTWEEAVKRVFLLASARGAHVLPSGFRSSMLDPGDLDRVEFLQGGNMALRRSVVEEFRFDETLDRFGGYALGEDVMFSYPVGRKYELYATGRARLKHFHTPGGRPEPYSMNKMYVVHQWRFMRETMRGGALHAAAYWYAICGLVLIRTIQCVRKPDARRRGALLGVFAGVAAILNGTARDPGPSRERAAAG